MKYNKSLDYVVLSMAAMMAGQPQRAARLFASACAQPDAKSGVAVLEFSNKHAFAQASKVQAAKRVTAMDEFPFEVESDVEDEDEAEDVDTEVTLSDDDEIDADLDGEDEDDLDEDEDPGEVMAKVLAGMARPSRKSR